MEPSTADAIVLAAGPSGLADTLSVAEMGVKVVIFEKASTLCSSGNVAAGLLVVESRLRHVKNIGPSHEGVFKAFMDRTHWHVTARMVKVFLDKSADTIDWLERLGATSVEPAKIFSGIPPGILSTRDTANMLPGLMPAPFLGIIMCLYW